MRRPTTLVPHALTLAAGLGLTFQAQALIYVVGAAPAPSQCDFNTIQAAINAAAANPGPDTIRIASDQSYTQQALTIGQQDLIIEGGWSNCAAALVPGATPNAGAAILDGAGGAAAPVISITGSGVREFHRVSIRGGDANMTTGKGGGINFRGTGDVVLRDVLVIDNSAGEGGGINFNAETGGSAVRAILTIGANTQVLQNTANDGGGVRIEGQARMFMLGPDSSIQGNTASASGFGGGLLVDAPAMADIGSTGWLGNGPIFNNTAYKGGGIAVRNGGNLGMARVRIFNADGERPVRIHGNRATLAGGLSVIGNNNAATGGRAVGCLANSIFEDNESEAGAAAVFSEFNAELDINGFVQGTAPVGPCQSPETVQTLGLRACSPKALCSGFVNNRITIQPIFPGIEGISIVGSLEGNRLTIVDTVFRSNSTQSLISAHATGSVVLDGLLVASNAMRGHVLKMSGNTQFEFRNSTVANNAFLGTGPVIRVTDPIDIAIRNAIIWQPGQQAFVYPANQIGNPLVRIADLITHDPGSFANIPTAYNVDPGFNDASIDDYRLRFSSAALDRSQTNPGRQTDLDGRARGVNPYGGAPTSLPFDIGAFERHAGDPIVVNGGFVQGTQVNFGVWRTEPPAPPLSVQIRTDINDGSDGTGSVEFTVPAAQMPAGVNRLNALSQCLRIPVGGTYRLTARALRTASSFGVIGADVPVLRWRYRANSADCSGPATTEGDADFVAASQWQSLVAPVDIVVPAPLIGFRPSIELRLDAIDNAPTTQLRGIFARFDNIGLTRIDGLPGGDIVFANGFD